MIFESKRPAVSAPLHDTFTSVFGSLSTQDYPKQALVDPKTGESFTYGELLENINAFAAALINSGLKRGEVLAVYAPNNVYYPIILYGVVRAGGIITTANPAYQVNELEHQLKDSGAKMVVAWHEEVDKATQAMKNCNLPEDGLILLTDPAHHDSYPSHSTVVQWLSKGKSLVQTTSFAVYTKEDCHATVCLCYSSGTTGLSKGVESTHDNLITNMHQISQMESFHQSDNVLAMLPFFHIYAMNILLHVALWKRETLIVQKRFDFKDFLTWIQEYRITKAFIVPPVALGLAKHPLVDEFDLTSLRVLVSGAAPLSAELIKDVESRIHVKIRQAYGMTEASPAITYTPPEDAVDGSSGLLVPSMQAKIIDPNGNLLGFNQRGELCVKGRNVMKGYLKNPKATAETLVDGWLHTGDVAIINENGHVYIVDRIKELIKYKGFQVAPAELEGLLLTHPSVGDCAIIGVPDEAAGELPKAFVVLKQGCSTSDKELIDFMAGQTAYYKQLRGGIEFVEAIPKSASGKILRRLLK